MDSKYVYILVNINKNFIRKGYQVKIVYKKASGKLMHNLA